MERDSSTLWMKFLIRVWLEIFLYYLVLLAQYHIFVSLATALMSLVLHEHTAHARLADLRAPRLSYKDALCHARSIRKHEMVGRFRSYPLFQNDRRWID